MQIEDKILAFAIAMFVMSQVSERISNFFKLYLHVLTFKKISLFQELDTHSKDEGMEKKRERTILFISLCSGALTTLLFWNFLSHIQEQEDNPLRWIKDYQDVWLFLFISIFLSFGAKFWHDFLDIIYFYKNAKRNLQEADFYKVDETSELEERLKRTPSSIMLQAYNLLKDNILKQEGVVDVAKGFNPAGRPCFRVRFKDRISAAKFENEIFWVDGLGIEYRFPVEKLITGRINAQSARIGGPIYNAATPKRRGTAGYIFKDKYSEEHYLLSCYHVMKANHSWDLFSENNNENILFEEQPGVPENIGKLRFGYRNTKLDVAIAVLNSLESVEKNSYPKITHSACVDEKYTGTPVKIKGMKSGIVDAYIYDTSVGAKINYTDESEQAFSNFFSLSLIDELKCPTVRGDSGALVYRENGEALGIIVGGSKLLAYAMKIPVIETDLGIQIIPSA